MTKLFRRILSQTEKIEMWQAFLLNSEVFLATEVEGSQLSGGQVRRRRWLAAGARDGE